MTAVVERQRASVCRAWGGEGQDTCQPTGRPAAAPERPWDPSASFQLRSCTRVRSPRIKRRSVTPNRANKWQMLWISLSSVTTEGLKGPGDCFHMKAASQQNHGKPLPALRTGWNWDVWSLSAYTQQKYKQAHKGRLWTVYLPRTWFGWTGAGDKMCCLGAAEPEHDGRFTNSEGAGTMRPELLWNNSCVVNLSPCHDDFLPDCCKSMSCPSAWTSVTLFV